MIPKRAGSGVRTEASVSRVEDALMAQAPRPLRPTRPRPRMRQRSFTLGIEASLCRHRADDRGASAFSLPSILLPSPPCPSVFSLLSLSSLWRPPPALASGRRLPADKRVSRPFRSLRRRRRRRLRVFCQGQRAGALGRPPARCGAAPGGRWR